MVPNCVVQSNWQCFSHIPHSVICSSWKCINAWNRISSWRGFLQCNFKECFHLTSQQPYWCPKTMKWWPYWCPKTMKWWPYWCPKTMKWWPYWCPKTMKWRPYCYPKLILWHFSSILIQTFPIVQQSNMWIYTP